VAELAVGEVVVVAVVVVEVVAVVVVVVEVVAVAVVAVLVVAVVVVAVAVVVEIVEAEKSMEVLEIVKVLEPREAAVAGSNASIYKLLLHQKILEYILRTDE